MQDLLFSKGSERRVCLFECSRKSLEYLLKRSSFDIVNLLSVLSFFNGMFKTLLSWLTVLRTSRKLSTNQASFFWKHSVNPGKSNVDLTSNQKKEKNGSKSFFVGASAISCNSKMRQGVAKVMCKFRYFYASSLKLPLVSL